MKKTSLAVSRPGNLQRETLHLLVGSLKKFYKDVKMYYEAQNPLSRHTPGLVTWLLWVILTIVGGTLGITITILNPNTTPFLNQILIWGFLSLPLFFVAVGQWLLLRRFVPRAGWWLLTGALGLLFDLPYLFFGLVIDSDGKAHIFGTQEFWGATLFLVILSLIFGGAVGLLQGNLVIKRYREGSRQLRRWIIASAIAFAIGFPIGQQFIASLFWLKPTPSTLTVAWLVEGTTWGSICSRAIFYPCL